LRSQAREALARVGRSLPPPRRIVLTADDERLAQFAAPDFAEGAPAPVAVLAGGTAAWFAQGRAGASGEDRLASPRNDRYRRPYEGTQNAEQAMQAYLDWEYGLVAQLARDGTHGFRVLGPAE